MLEMKKVEIKLSNGKYLITNRELEENSSTRVKSALFNRGGKIRTFAILTAENPMGEPTSAQENNVRMGKLRADLKMLGLQYIKVTGSYGTIEHSLMIVNIPYADAETLAGNYMQESFIFGDENGIHYYQIDEKLLKDSGKIKYNLIETSNRVDTLKDADDYFSRHGDLKFSVYYDMFNESLKLPTNEDEFNMSMENNRTVKSRRLHRALAYKNATHPNN